ncbi:MAG: hypothetical protein ACM3QS_08930, partial [Bacteroidota bacterium]
TEPPATPAGPSALPSPTTVSSAALGWMQYRDPRYGYGIALPCYWSVTPTPMEGTYAAMTARSYSDEFFAQHSERGEWLGGVWPAGAYKLDAVVFENMDASLPVPDALRLWYSIPQNASEQQLVAVEETSFGSRTSYLATLQGGLQGAEKVRIVYFPLRPGRLIGFVFLPGTALESPDVQAILASFVPTSAEAVNFPGRPPAETPGGGPVSCS